MYWSESHVVHNEALMSGHLDLSGTSKHPPSRACRCCQSIRLAPAKHLPEMKAFKGSLGGGQGGLYRAI